MTKRPSHPKSISTYPKGFPNPLPEFTFEFQSAKKVEHKHPFQALGIYPKKLWNAPISGLAKALGFEKEITASKDLELQWKTQVEKLEKQNSLKDSSKNGIDSKTISYELNFSSGSKWTFVFVDASLSSFQLHTDLRKSCTSFFDPSIESERHIDVSRLAKTEQENILHALGFLSQVSHWEPFRFTSKKSDDSTEKSNDKKRKPIFVSSAFQSKALTETAESAQRLGWANTVVRSLGDLPCNVLNPSQYRIYVEAFAKANGLKYEFHDLKALAKMGAEAFLAVIRACPTSACGIAVLKYTPKKPSKSRKKLALIGKGLTFDTGGYNVKVGNHMLGMNHDMLGSATVLALTGALAQEEFPHEVTTYLAIAENLISTEAYKPNEVVTAMDGTTIEVVDTDAEGRMVLSDTLALARLEKPDLALDFATLTGAVIRAIDTRRSGVYTHTPKLVDLALKAGEISGERVWHFPIGDDYRTEGLQSKIADLLQCSTSNNADHIYAATFLSHFIGAETPWIHMDLAGAHHEGGLGLVSSSNTGFGVRWARELIRLYWTA